MYSTNDVHDRGGRSLLQLQGGGPRFTPGRRPNPHGHLLTAVARLIIRAATVGICRGRHPRWWWFALGFACGVLVAAAVFTARNAGGP